ncbi:hypothetical protein ACOME3_006947 [Neoechinorhynchus agilis]
MPSDPPYPPPRRPSSMDWSHSQSSTSSPYLRPPTTYRTPVQPGIPMFSNQNDPNLSSFHNQPHHPGSHMMVTSQGHYPPSNMNSQSVYDVSMRSQMINRQSLMADVQQSAVRHPLAGAMDRNMMPRRSMSVSAAQLQTHQPRPPLNLPVFFFGRPDGSEDKFEVEGFRRILELVSSIRISTEELLLSLAADPCALKYDIVDDCLKRMTSTMELIHSVSQRLSNSPSLFIPRIIAYPLFHTLADFDDKAMDDKLTKLALWFQKAKLASQAIDQHIKGSHFQNMICAQKPRLPPLASVKNVNSLASIQNAVESISTDGFRISIKSDCTNDNGDPFCRLVITCDRLIRIELLIRSQCILEQVAVSLDSTGTLETDGSLIAAMATDSPCSLPLASRNIMKNLNHTFYSLEGECQRDLRTQIETSIMIQGWQLCDSDQPIASLRSLLYFIQKVTKSLLQGKCVHCKQLLDYHGHPPIWLDTRVGDLRHGFCKFNAE